MAKAKGGNGEKTERTNGALVFEEMGKDFEIPGRQRSATGAYAEVVQALKGTTKVVAVYHSGPNAKGANTRRKSLLQAAEAAGLKIEAAVRAMKDANGQTDNILFARVVSE